MTAELFRFYLRLMGFGKRAVQREAEQRAQLAVRPHQVLMRFQRFPTGWQVRFTPVGSDWVLRVCTFADDEKIRSMWRRFSARRMSEDVQMFEFAVKTRVANPSLVSLIDSQAALGTRLEFEWHTSRLRSGILLTARSITRKGYSFVVTSTFKCDSPGFLRSILIAAMGIGPRIRKTTKSRRMPIGSLTLHLSTAAEIPPTLCYRRSRSRQSTRRQQETRMSGRHGRPH